MHTHLSSLDSLVHPHQMEIQEFDFYALVIDSRSTEAYQDDHLPGAVSLPAAADGHAGGVATFEGAGRALSVAEAPPAMPYALAVKAQHLSPGDTVLVYCDRGGLDSLVWAAPLRAAGFRVDVLGGGWVNYRRWVNAGLELLPRALTLRPILAPPAGGLCRVYDSLVHRGEQVIDLPALAWQRLVPGLTLQGDSPSSQAAFETSLLDAIRRFNPERPVWFCVGLAGLGGLTLPPALRDALNRATGMRLETPLNARAVAWSDRLQAAGADITSLLHAISASAMPPPTAVIEQWRLLVQEGKVIDALSEVIKAYIDPHCELNQGMGPLNVVRLASLTAEVVAAEVDRWRSSGTSPSLGGYDGH